MPQIIVTEERYGNSQEAYKVSYGEKHAVVLLLSNPASVIPNAWLVLYEGDWKKCKSKSTAIRVATKLLRGEQL